MHKASRVQAAVIDFKTDEVAEADLPQAARRYRPQLSLYGQALSRMLELNPVNDEAQAGVHSLGENG